MHAAGIMLDRSVYEAFDLCEGNDFIKFSVYLDASHAEDCAVQVYVLTPAQLQMKACTHFQHAADATINVHLTVVSLGDARKDFEQCGLACAIAPDDANNFARRNFKTDIFQRPDGIAAIIPISPKPAERGA